MKVLPDRYVIGQVISDKGRGYFLAKVEKEAKEGYLVRFEEDCHFKHRRGIVSADSLVLNLGKNPSPGVVYGFDLSSLYRKTITTKLDYEIHLFENVSEETEAKISRALDRAVKKLKEFGLGALAEQSIIFQIFPKKGKWSGWFTHPKHAGKENEEPSKITLALNPQKELNDYSDYVYLHEFGHAFHHYFLKASKKLESKWLNLYRASIAPTVVEAKTVKSMYKDFQAAESCAAWKKSYEELELKNCASVILRHISQSHKLTPRDLNILLDAEDYDSLKEVWPDCDLHSTELKPLITEYATTNYSETIAEAFAFHLMGKSLPKSVDKLMRESIQYALGAK